MLGGSERRSSPSPPHRLGDDHLGRSAMTVPNRGGDSYHDRAGDDCPGRVSGDCPDRGGDYFATGGDH